MISESESPAPKSKVEGIKDESNYLRGRIVEELADTSTGGISEDSYQLCKFHGTYLQDDRDQRRERRKQKLEKAFIFMIRVRVPGGVCSPKQWLDLDTLADKYANGTLKLTTRQAFQYHGVLKQNLKSTIKEINDTLLDTLAACGDVNRNVMCNVNPHESKAHAQAQDIATKISDHLTPRTTAYHEIWLDDKKVAGGQEDEEPIYGKHYLPRKFKIAIAIPPHNDVDIFANDLGYIAVIENGEIIGYNVTVGGGMGMSHNKPETYPQVARVLGFCTPDQAVDIAEKVVTTQRDYGDREERKHARLKYTIDDRGLDWFRNEVESRLGYKLGEARPYEFTDNGDRIGWVKGEDGQWHLTLFILSGRVKDEDGLQVKTALRKIAEIHEGDLRLTGNQNLVIGNCTEEAKGKIDAILREHGVDPEAQYSGVRRNSMSCVALPTCGLALSESERMLPDFVSKVESVVEAAGLKDDEITLRVTGCPNGCGRPYLAEIGLVGKIPGKYNVYLGGAFDGSRLNKLFAESVKEDEIPEMLQPILERYARERNKGERFGNFCVRAGVINETTDGQNFHDGTPVADNA